MQLIKGPIPAFPKGEGEPGTTQLIYKLFFEAPFHILTCALASPPFGRVWVGFFPSLHLPNAIDRSY